MTSFTVEYTDPLSKALSKIIDTGAPVVVVKNNRYYGMIDDRHLPSKVVDSTKVKCGSVAVKAPTITKKTDLLKKIHLFLSSRLKGLAVVSKHNRPVSIITRSDLIEEMLDEGIVPDIECKYLMNVPAYSIDADATLSELKEKLRRLNMHHLLVSKSGRGVGIVSEYDLAVFLLKPAKRRGKSVITNVKSILSKIKVKDVLRERLVVFGSNERLPKVCRAMVNKKISSVFVKDSSGKIVGIISSTDIFNRVLGMFKEETKITISGLKEPDLIYYQDIKTTFEKIAKKFSKSFNIRSISVRVKSTKSVYVLHVAVHTYTGTYTFTTEHHEFEDAIADAASTLVKFLNKLRSKRYKSRERDNAWDIIW